MSIFSLLAARSISIFETPACEKRFFSVSRSFRSSCSSFVYYWYADHRDRHVLLKPSRNPVG
jgi:hypothetical protein